VNVLTFAPEALDEMLAHAYAGLPDEACGLLLGAADRVDRFFACGNAAASSRIYAIGPRDFMAAEDQADEAGLTIVGVMHSHTHTEPYPSPTDVAQAVDPAWRYVIVSLKRDYPEPRSYLIVDGAIAEEPIAVAPGNIPDGSARL
jgi:proteasome lid subunit RPN8/RPN11